MKKSKVTVEDKIDARFLIISLSVSSIVGLILILLTPLGVVTSYIISLIVMTFIYSIWHISWDKKNGYEWRHSKEYKEKVDEIRNRYKFNETFKDKVFRVLVTIIMICTAVTLIVYDIINKYNNNIDIPYVITLIMGCISLIIIFVQYNKEKDMHKEIEELNKSEYRL